MTQPGAWWIIIFSILGKLAALPLDDFSLDHAVTYDDAIRHARNLTLYPGPIAGCKSCTSEEIMYCRDGRILEDHCCCDGKYNEVFEFVEHACYIGPDLCKLHAGNCAEYVRLRECCCHGPLASFWKSIAGGAEKHTSTWLLPFLAILIVLRLL